MIDIKSSIHVDPSKFHPFIVVMKLEVAENDLVGRLKCMNVGIEFEGKLWSFTKKPLRVWIGFCRDYEDNHISNLLQDGVMYYFKNQVEAEFFAIEAKVVLEKELQPVITEYGNLKKNKYYNPTR